MPGGDGTGPLGRGPGRGICIGAGFRRGSGSGRGLGMGRGSGSGICPVDASSPKVVLENRAALLEQELAVLKARMGKDSEAE